jgi:tRNA (cytidine/uridine-2'-O-)-methyltransferase
VKPLDEPIGKRIDESVPLKDVSKGRQAYRNGKYCYHFPKRIMVHVALYEPEIPPNTGNIARLCAATFTPLHVVGVTGFKMDDRTLKRAGLDYWQEVDLHRHIDLDGLYAALPTSRFLYLTTKVDRNYTDWEFSPDDCLVFGPETRGLPEDLLARNRETCLTIPMPNPSVRSLNLANSVGIVLYEALRQIGVATRR